MLHLVRIIISHKYHKRVYLHVIEITFGVGVDLTRLTYSKLSIVIDRNERSHCLLLKILKKFINVHLSTTRHLHSMEWNHLRIRSRTEKKIFWHYLLQYITFTIHFWGLYETLSTYIGVLIIWAFVDIKSSLTLILIGSICKSNMSIKSQWSMVQMWFYQQVRRYLPRWLHE